MSGQFLFGFLPIISIVQFNKPYLVPNIENTSAVYFTDFRFVII